MKPDNKSAFWAAAEASNEILKFYHCREFTSTKPIPSSGFLFHYTTADGLKGIIEKNELWATSAYFLNDSSEISYGCGVLREVLDFWIAQNSNRSASLSLRLAQDIRKSFGDDASPSIYVACFCEKDDLLSQWRAYGQSGGYSFGFKVPASDMSRGFKPEASTYTAKWVKVHYDRSEQVKKCRSVLDSVLAMSDNPKIAQAIADFDSHPQVGYPVFQRLLIDILLEEIVSFKNKAFAVEEEWRVVVRQRELVKQGTDDGGKLPAPINFRSSKGVLIPYIRLIPTSPPEKLPIACIRSGPTLEKATTAMGVRMMLEKNGFPNVQIEGSDIPVRL